ncbi:MAG: BamA/TamA family outer membrane protein, partial [Candidatus Brocadiae bacterium]|nr:BamA/TamA family outer membrane protein [Candidatus Brocadiia bacterium]
TVRQERGRRKHVVGVRGRLGLVDSYSRDVPVFERFYAGGFSTLRGFEFEGVSPSDPATGAQIGGESMLLGSVEYSFPLSEEAGVRLVTFCDAGYVSEEVGDIFTGWDELRLSVGAGIRWQVAYFGPLVVEFDLAAPLLRESDDETQAYHFSFGLRQAF